MDFPQKTLQGHEVTVKRCKRCDKVLPIENFYLSKGGKDGYCCLCKLCHAIACKERSNKRKMERTK
jgi:hypothetical protein